MAKITTLFGTILIILGAGGYLLTAMEHWTALIPAFFGIIFVILGRLAVRENLRKLTMHAAAVLALLLIFPTVGALADLIGGATDIRILIRALTAIAAIIFLAFCVKSFIDARKARNSAVN